MARRGAKPTPAHLRLVQGTVNVTRHGKAAAMRDAVKADSSSFGKLVQPKHLKGEAAAIWKRLIAPARWLDASREGSAIAFCELWGEFRDHPRGFAASKHGQMRAYMSELGLTDERNRGRGKDEKARDEFFDD